MHKEIHQKRYQSKDESRNSFHPSIDPTCGQLLPGRNGHPQLRQSNNTRQHTEEDGKHQSSDCNSRTRSFLNYASAIHDISRCAGERFPLQKKKSASSILVAWRSAPVMIFVTNLFGHRRERMSSVIEQFPSKA